MPSAMFTGVSWLFRFRPHLEPGAALSLVFLVFRRLFSQWKNCLCRANRRWHHSEVHQQRSQLVATASSAPDHHCLLGGWKHALYR